jgi:hypothetical protein
MNENLKKELEFFKENQTELLQKYEGKFLVIKDKKVFNNYDSEITAYQDAIKHFELGTFIIQQCLPGENAYTQTFHSRVLAK